MKSSHYAKFALVFLALLAARPAHAQPVGNFLLLARTDPATGEDRSTAILITQPSTATRAMLSWSCVAAGGLIVTLSFPWFGREGDARPVAYRFDDEPWDSVTASRLDPSGAWYLQADDVAPFTLRAKRARRLVIRGDGDLGQVQYQQYDVSRGGEALDKLSCARGTPTPGRPLPYDELSSGVTQGEVSAVVEMPQLQNRSDMVRSIRQNYPRMLRDAGVVGRVTLRALILESGEVESTSVTVNESTLESFNEAATNVVRGMRFTPARIEGGRAVRVWVTVPVTFSPDVGNP